MNLQTPFVSEIASSMFVALPPVASHIDIALPAVMLCHVTEATYNFIEGHVYCDYNNDHWYEVGFQALNLTSDRSICYGFK